MNSQLSPEAPIYIPPPLRNITNTTSSQKSPYIPKKLTPTTKEPQCSRYSRKSVRQLEISNSPRPILGTRCTFPRPILGRKSDEGDDEFEEQFIGKEFRSMTRNIAKLNIQHENSTIENVEEEET